MKLSVKCPDKLSSYIEKAFQKCISQSERDFMDGALKRICNAAKDRGSLLSKDWDAMQLPSLPREGKQKEEHKLLISLAQGAYFKPVGIL